MLTSEIPVLATIYPAPT